MNKPEGGQNTQETGSDRLTKAYHQLLSRLQEILGRSSSKTSLNEAMDQSQKQAVKEGELDRLEAERLGGFLLRDLTDMGGYFARTGQGLRHWLRFDVQLVERRLWEMLTQITDHAREDMMALQQGERPPHYLTGEITLPGTLICENCQRPLHFKKAGPIPPCPHCRGKVFIRPID